jgi:hypothetical protein
MGQPPLESSIDIAATPDAVWAEVTDLKAMARRSPELVGMWLLGKPKVGRRSIHLNRRKGFVWPTTGRITQWKPPSNDNGRGAFVFHVWPTNVDWSYETEPTATGTRLVERRTALVDPSLSVRLTARLALGGSDNHDRELCDGMDQTLAAIKADVGG